MAMPTQRRTRSRCGWTMIVCLAALVVVLVLSGYQLAPYRYNMQDYLSYSTRPLWDADEAPKAAIAHLSSPGIATNDSDACARHGWTLARPHTRRVWDATLISTELDLLEIRLRELWDVVDVFLIMESTHTMTGIVKQVMHFAENRQRFRQWDAKIRYIRHTGREQRSSDGAFTLANEVRWAMTNFINSQSDINSGSADDELLIIMADVDEIPSRQSIELIKTCQTPLPLHLQLKNYLYSFEFATLANSWRASVHKWSVARTSGGYGHGKATEDILTASGWHCSFCFATLAEFKYKMMAASHVDRLLKRPNFQSYLTDASIQARVCQGKDLYDMPPEMYTLSDLMQFWNGARQTLGNTVPMAVLADWKRFEYLLPGHCARESGTLDANIVPEKLGRFA